MILLGGVDLIAVRYLREALALAGLALQIAIVWYFWSALPPQVPMHFGATGTVDSYGDKSTLMILPAITFGLYVLLTVIGFFPRSFNYPVEVTEENRGRLQATALTMMGWLKVELVWLFAYISWAVIRVALGRANSLGWAFLPVTLGVVGLTLALGIVHMRRTAA
jgi:uncharacterized membrane protein